MQTPGWVDPSARERLLRRASVVAIPSRWPEPFGLVGLEAAAAGVPVVAFDVGGISSWLSDGVNGLLVAPGGGASAFGASLARVLSDDSLRERLARGAIAAAKQFSRDAHLQALEVVLRGAMAA
jgi:glycosyltransferase involved in cell wall biosynthesis